MNELLVALQSWWLSSGFPAQFPGGFYRDQHPEGSPAMPYLIYTVIGSPRSLNYGSGYSAPLIQFAAYGEDTADGTPDAGDLLEQFMAALEAADLSLANGNAFDFRWLGDPIPTLQPHDAGGQDVWQWMAQAQFAIRR